MTIDKSSSPVEQTLADRPFSAPEIPVTRHVKIPRFDRERAQLVMTV